MTKLHRYSNEKPAGMHGFSAVYLALSIVILGILVVIGLVVAGSQGSDEGLVPIEGPKNVRVDEKPVVTGDKLPAGFVAYTNPTIGFSFAFPSVWGALNPVVDETSVLNLATAPLREFSLADSFQVRVDTLEEFQIQINDKGVIVSPKPSGAGYEWVVVDNGTDKISVGKVYTPGPPIVYRSGKATVYAFSASKEACTYTTWVFAVQDGMARLRLPSFCISDKVADSDVQATHKAAFEKIKKDILQSITVL